MNISKFLSKTMTHFVFQRKSTIKYYQICYLNNELFVYQFQKKYGNIREFVLKTMKYQYVYQKTHEIMVNLLQNDRILVYFEKKL